MQAKGQLLLIATGMLVIALVAGCSGGSSANSGASSASAGAATKSASVSTSASSASGASSQASGAAQDSASASAGASNDFDRALIGTWHIYSYEASKNATTRVGPELMRLLGELGLHDTLTFYSDGTYLINYGGGKTKTLNWTEVDYSTFELPGYFDDPNIAGDPGEDILIKATIANNRLTLEYDDPERGHVKIAYSKS